MRFQLLRNRSSVRAMTRLARFASAALALLGLASSAAAQGELNVYSSRHYDSDDELYALFEEQTGIEVNVIEADTDALLQRLEREGDLSPADVFIAVDAGRLHPAVERGLLAQTDSRRLEREIPESLRHPDGLWFGFSRRARVIVVPWSVPLDAVQTYGDLAGDRFDDAVLTRSSQNIYNQSLVASLIANLGEEEAQAWVNGIVENFAREPQGGDRDQIRAVAAGEGEAAIVNHYYFARMLAGDDSDDREAAAKLRLVFPNQQDRGTHVNVSGAGVLKNSPNRENAQKFLEFLTTPEAQELWALANFEYPVITSDALELPEVLQNFGEFKADELNASKLGELNREAVEMMDRAGWR